MNQSISLAEPAPITDERVRFYDARARLYDFVVGSRLYHQFAWGMHPGEHTSFAAQALQGSRGAVLDGGCGSLLFTAARYRDVTRPLTLLDASRGMLARAERRLYAGGKGPSLGHVRFVQGDLARLPFDAESFGAVFHFGVLHCVERPADVLAELHRVLVPGGQFFLSSLVLGRARGDKLLARLAKAGHVAQPRSAQEVEKLTRAGGFRITNSSKKGSFLFVEATRE